MDSEIIKLPPGLTAGDQGKSTARIHRETIPNDDIKSKVAKRRLMDLADFLKPPGTRVMGAAVVYFYETKGSDENRPSFVNICQTAMEKVPEGYADYGHKRLQEALMAVYGREPQKIRQDV